jgi:hypothetical protein
MGTAAAVEQEEAPDTTIRIPEPQIAGWSGKFQPYVASGNIPAGLKDREFHIRDPQSREELLALVGGKDEAITALAKAPLRTYFTRQVGELAKTDEVKAMLERSDFDGAHEYIQAQLNVQAYGGRAGATRKPRTSGKNKLAAEKAAKLDQLAQIASQDTELMARLQAYGIKL